MRAAIGDARIDARDGLADRNRPRRPERRPGDVVPVVPLVRERGRDPRVRAHPATRRPGRTVWNERDKADPFTSEYGRVAEPPQHSNVYRDAGRLSHLRRSAARGRGLRRTSANARSATCSASISRVCSAARAAHRTFPSTARDRATRRRAASAARRFADPAGTVELVHTTHVFTGETAGAREPPDCDPLWRAPLLRRAPRANGTLLIDDGRVTDLAATDVPNEALRFEAACVVPGTGQRARPPGDERRAADGQPVRTHDADATRVYLCGKRAQSARGRRHDRARPRRNRRVTSTCATRSRPEELPGPTLVVAGRVICMTGGHGWWIGRESRTARGTCASPCASSAKPAPTASSSSRPAAF